MLTRIAVIITTSAIVSIALVGWHFGGDAHDVAQNVLIAAPIAVGLDWAWVRWWSARQA
jgi:hypothetical protein